MGKIARALTVAAERVHNVTAEPVADTAKFLGRKTKEAKAAISTEHARAEEARAERKAKRAEERAEEARKEALEATKDLMDQLFPEGVEFDPEILRAAIVARSTEVEVEEEVTEPPAKAKGRVRKAKASA
jgi:hypothetical protein